MSKTQTTMLTKGSLNPIVDCPNISTLSNASVGLSTRNPTKARF